jgi:hypothetical protein
MQLTVQTGLMALLIGQLCACSNNINAALSDSGEQVTFVRHTGLCLDSVMVSLPDGETFIGYLNETAATDADCMIGAHLGTASTHSMLYGDRINTMECDFHTWPGNLAEAPEATKTCVLSDNRTLYLATHRK